MKLTVKTCEIFPSMGMHSQDVKHAGAWRLHVLAATLDRTQNATQDAPSRTHGRIERATLEAAAAALGVKRSTYFTWLADARQAGILNGAGKYLYLASQEKLSTILLCNSIDNHKAIVPIKLLFKPGWKDIVWAAYLKVNHHTRIGYTEKLQPVYKANVISARTLEDLTGVPERTQRRLNKHIKSRRNIAITDIPGSYETAAGMNEESQRQGKARHYFPYNDMQQKDPAGIKDYRRVIAFTLPASREVSNKSAVIGARGRRAQIQRAILKGLQLVNVCNYPSINYLPKVQAGRQMEAKRTGRRYFDQRQEIKHPASEVFIERGRHVGVWDRVGEGF